MSKTQTATTVHGEVEYTTVECDSCGNECVANEALDFTIGDREGKACPHCYEEGPVSFPRKAKERLIQGFGTWSATNGATSFIPILLAFPIFALLTFIGSLVDGSGMNEQAQAFGWALWCVALWVGAIALVAHFTL